MTTERIAAAIKPILDEDRRADRERIAELERDAAHLRQLNSEIIDTYNKQLDELTEKCAALVVERDAIGRELGESRRALAEEFKASQRAKPEAPTLRIDPDMSDPQPGKLLVVQVNLDDCVTMPANWINEKKRQEWVGFLVETPAVEVKRTPRVGDRVRVIDGANAGEEAAVRAIDSIDPDCFCLMLADGERWFAHVDNLEVIE